MISLHNNEDTCYLTKYVYAGKAYRITVNIDGIFHIRFSIKDAYNNAHLEWITNTIYGETGSYTYVITPKTDGYLSICKSKGRLNTWTALAINVEEASDETNI